MYSRQQMSEMRQAFWTALGLYMTPILSAEGEKINWINYKTGQKHIHLKMEADASSAKIYIQLSHRDETTRLLNFDKLQQSKTHFDFIMQQEWQWQSQYTNEHGQTLSIVAQSLHGANIFDKQDWPALITFFKTNLIAFDAFWSTARYAFETQ